MLYVLLVLILVAVLTQSRPGRVLLFNLAVAGVLLFVIAEVHNAHQSIKADRSASVRP